VESRKCAVVSLLLSLGLAPTRVSRGEGPPSCSKVARENLVRCALGSSLVVQVERKELEVAQAREVAVSPLLPANPVLALTAAKPTNSSFNSYDWSASLSQEIEVAGQRGLRRPSTIGPRW